MSENNGAPTTKDRWAAGVTPYAQMGYWDADYEPVASVAGSRVRMVGYDPALLSPVRLPAAVICSPPEQV